MFLVQFMHVFRFLGELPGTLNGSFDKTCPGSVATRFVTGNRGPADDTSTYRSHYQIKSTRFQLGGASAVYAEFAHLYTHLDLLGCARACSVVHAALLC